MQRNAIKKILILMLLLFQFLIFDVFSQSWQYLDTPGFSSGASFFNDITIDGNGTPYVVYRDDAASFKAVVKKFNGTNWTTVGISGFSAGYSDYTSIAIDASGTPYVSYADLGNSALFSIMKFNGTNWVTSYSSGVAHFTSIAIDGNNVPYVVYTDGNTPFKATVIKFNGVSWVTVGASGFSAGEAKYTKIAIDGNNIPYVVYRDEGNASKATVVKFNGTNWVNVGTAGFSAGVADYTSIAIDGSNTPYVVYEDWANSQKATVMKFNGSSWINVGTAGFSAGVADYSNIKIDINGSPVVVYQDYANSQRTTVMKFDGTNWTTVGTSGFSAGVSNNIALAIDASNNYYVTFRDGSNSNKATVMKMTLLPPPTLTTTAISSITGTTASSGGNVSSDGGASVTVRGVVWSTSTSPTTALATKTSDGTGTGVFVSSITGLSLNTTYYVRAYATNSVGTSYGNEITFTTLNIPTETTTAISALTGISATSGGNVSSNGGSAITARGVVWNTITTPTVANSKTIDVSVTSAFTSFITGLSLNTTYYVRAYATNSVGTSYGNEITFTTLNIPTLTSTIVSSITGTTSNSGGNISSDGGASVTARGVCWNTSSSPTIANSKSNDGSGTGAFTSSLTGLSFVTTYYVRAYATNSVGTSYGNEVTFTSNASSVVKIGKSNTQAQNKVVITATAVDDGGVTITERGFVLSGSKNPTLLSGTKHIDASTGLGDFQTTFYNLASSSQFYIRAYATNADGTSYSENSLAYTTDLDGYSADDENSAPNGDGNNDGRPDYSQENVVSFNGISNNVVTIASLDADQILSSSNTSGPKNTVYSYPFGVFAYTINASQATVKIYFHGTESLRKYVYRKLSANGRWINFEHAVFSSEIIDHKSVAVVTLTLTDGDPASDADGVRNGVIVDPGGPAFIADPEIIPVWDWKYVVLLMCMFGIWIYKSKIV